MALARRKAKPYFHLPSILVFFVAILVGNAIRQSRALISVGRPGKILDGNIISTTNINTAVIQDGCGLVDDQHSSTWVELTPSEKEDAAQVQACLKNIGNVKYVSQIDNMGLNCTIQTTFDVVRSTLSQYNTVWLHGDSVMEQLFYTLACMVNHSVVLPNRFDLGGPRKMQWTKGLGYDGIEHFTYSYHSPLSSPRGSIKTTKFIYSRFGRKWGLDDNLYKYDFPLAVQTLTSSDAILVNAAAHFDGSTGSQLDRAMTFIAEQSTLTNATMFYLEPHPEEWPTSNGMYTQSCIFRCTCERLNKDRLAGRGIFTQPGKDESVDQKYILKDGKPDLSFFQRLYPDLAWDKNTTNNDVCIPNCLPATWRKDFINLQLLGKKVHHNLNIIPVFWQLVSKETPSGRGRGDCTHKDLYGTLLMAFQWTRTIIHTKRLENGSSNINNSAATDSSAPTKIHNTTRQDCSKIKALLERYTERNHTLKMLAKTLSICMGI